MKAPALMTLDLIGQLRWPRLRQQLAALRWVARRHVGWAGLLGALLCLAAAGLWGGLDPALQARRAAALRSSVGQLERQPLGPAGAGPDPRDAARADLPALAERAALVRTLLQQAEASGMATGRSAYTVQAQAPALSRLRVTLTLGGSYAQLRKFVGSTLNGMPNVALDSMQLARSEERPGEIDATLRLSLFFRDDQP